MRQVTTLDDIFAERQHILKRRAHFESERAKLDEKIGDLNIELNHLDIQEGRLRKLGGINETVLDSAGSSDPRGML